MSRLNGTEFKVLCALCRKIFGFHKENFRDRISISQMEKMTGVNRQALWKATEKLEQLGLCKKYVAGTNGQEATVYELVVSNNNDQGENHPAPRVKITPTKENKLNKYEFEADSSNQPKETKQTPSMRPDIEALPFGVKDKQILSRYPKEAVAYAKRCISRMPITPKKPVAVFTNLCKEYLSRQDQPTQEQERKPYERWGRLKNKVDNKKPMIDEIIELCGIAKVYCSDTNDDLLVIFDGKEYHSFKSDALFEKTFNECIRMLNEKISRITKRG